MTIWIYLARRDAKSIKLITMLSGGICPPKRLDLAKMQLPAPVRAAIEKIIHDNRMMWEPWIQSANSLSELLHSLMARGYSVPRKCRPEISLSAIEKNHNLSWKRSVNLRKL